MPCYDNHNMATETKKPTHVAIYSFEGEIMINSFSKNDIQSMYKSHPYTRQNVEENNDPEDITPELVFDQLVADVQDTSEGRILTRAEAGQFATKLKSEFAKFLPSARGYRK